LNVNPPSLPPSFLPSFQDARQSMHLAEATVFARAIFSTISGVLSILFNADRKLLALPPALPADAAVAAAYDQPLLLEEKEEGEREGGREGGVEGEAGRRQAPPLPEPEAGLFSLWSFSWLNPILSVRKEGGREEGRDCYFDEQANANARLPSLPPSLPPLDWLSAPVDTRRSLPAASPGDGRRDMRAAGGEMAARAGEEGREGGKEEEMSEDGMAWAWKSMNRKSKIPSSSPYPPSLPPSLPRCSTTTQLHRAKPSLARALWKSFGLTFFVASAYKFAYDTLLFVGKEGREGGIVGGREGGKEGWIPRICYAALLHTFPPSLPPSLSPSLPP